VPTVALATSDLESPYHIEGLSLGALWTDMRVATSVMPLFTTGSFENARLIARHRAECGFMSSNWLARAAMGAAPFDKPQPLALMAPINIGPLFFVVPADSKLSSLSDLRGKRIGVGYQHSGMIQHIRAIFEALDIPFEAIQPVYVHSNEGNRLLLEGEIHAQFEPPIPNPHFDALARQMPLKVLTPTEEERRVVTDLSPLYGDVVIPAGAFPGHDRDTTEIAVINVIAVHAQEREDLVFRLTRAVIEGAEELERRNALFRNLDGLLKFAGRKLMPVLGLLGAPAHPGAARAFRAAGYIA
jgi:TRAP transporter TAXI family solute receptor